MSTFKDYMEQYNGVDHRFGDLANDIARDKDFPNSNDFYTNLQHLYSSGACSECIETFFDAWSMYHDRFKDNQSAYLALYTGKITDVLDRIADSLEQMADYHHTYLRMKEGGDCVKNTAKVVEEWEGITYWDACGDCKTLVRDGWKYCPKCGAKLEWK